MEPQDAFALLANSDRYYAVQRLIEAGGTTTVEKLSEDIADRFEEATTEQAKIAVVHNHVPKLEEAGVVEHRNGVVVLTDAGAKLEALIDAARELDEESELTVAC